MSPATSPGTHNGDGPAGGPHPDDAALLRAHVNGDPEAFGVLFERHRDRLWAVALRTMGNPDDAADALQEGVISAFRKAGQFRGDAQVTTWLHRIVVNACLDRLRAMKVRAADALPDDLESGARRGSVVTADPGADGDPEREAERHARREDVLRALATLPDEQRAALVLVDMEGYPVAEVARMLECAEGTVKSRCARGRAKLAPLLKLHAPPGEDRPHGNQTDSAPVPSQDAARAPPADGADSSGAGESRRTP